MSKKRTTLRSTAIAERKLLSGDTSTIDVASNHNGPTVGKLTEQTPDTFKIVDTTERVIELEIVNNELLPRQRNTDKELTTDGSRKAKASPRQMTDNEEGTPFFELSSSDEAVNKEIDTKELILELQKTMNEVILKLLERPTRNHEEKQRRKNLRKKEAKHLTDDTGTGNAVMQSRATSHQSGKTDNVIHQLVRSDSESSE